MQWIIENKPFAVRWNQEFKATDPYKVVRLKCVTETGAFDYDFTDYCYNRRSWAEGKADELNEQHQLEMKKKRKTN